MVAAWSAPVLYMWLMVRDALEGWMFGLYMLNPLTVAVELFHYAFWRPTVDGAVLWTLPPQFFALWVPISFALSFGLLLVGDMVFRRLEGKFAQEL